MRKLVLGGAQFGDGYGSVVKTGKLSKENIDEILLAAIQSGCNVCDLAMSYSNAIQNVAKSEMKSHFSFINKISFRDWSAHFELEMINSLEMLGASKFEGILIHDWAVLDGKERLSALNLLDSLKRNGITKNVGISVYDTEELRNCSTGIDIVQAPLNFYKRNFVKNRYARNLMSTGVKFHARSIFNQGILLNLDNDIRSRFPELRDFELYCTSNNLSSIEGALSIFDNQDLFDSLVVGVSSASDLKAIINSRRFSISNLQNGWDYVYKQEISDPRLWTN